MTNPIAALTVDPPSKAANYNKAFQDRPPLASTENWVVGTWCIGNYYKNPNRLYGAYPHGYLERVHSMFPDVQHVLHVFSGGLDRITAWKKWAMSVPRPVPLLDGSDNYSLELVDIMKDDLRQPTWQGDILAMPEDWNGRFDLVMADPPYSSKDAEQYGTPMVNRAKVIRKLREVTQLGGSLVWLDVCWPMHRKEQWKTWGQIGLVRSTNHRVRLVSMFEAM